MTIKYINNQLTIVAPEINDFITNIINYTGISIITNITCTTDNEVDINTTDIIDSTKNIYIQNNVLYILPQYFSSNIAFVDGVYKITIKFNTSNGYVKIYNCYFVDVTLSCKVGSLLQNIITENEVAGTEPISSMAHLLHYSLVNGSNCGCNCDEMCQVYTYLLDLLTDVNTNLINDCGC